MAKLLLRDQLEARLTTMAHGKKCENFKHCLRFTFFPLLQLSGTFMQTWYYDFASSFCWFSVDFYAYESVWSLEQQTTDDLTLFYSYEWNWFQLSVLTSSTFLWFDKCLQHSKFIMSSIHLQYQIAVGKCRPSSTELWIISGVVLWYVTWLLKLFTCIEFSLIFHMMLCVLKFQR